LELFAAKTCAIGNNGQPPGMDYTEVTVNSRQSLPPLAPADQVEFTDRLIGKSEPTRLPRLILLPVQGQHPTREKTGDFGSEWAT